METTYTYTMVLHPTDIQGLNNSYGHIIRKGHGRPYAQRFLIPDAVRYKKRWSRLFSIQNTSPTFHNVEEGDKPFMMLKFLFVYESDFFAYSTGRLKGFDISNLFKLIEDSFCEHVGIDDSRTLAIIGEKVSSKEFTTQIVFSVTYFPKYELIENDSNSMEGYEPFLFRRSEVMSVQQSSLPALVGYSSLDTERRKKADDILASYCANEEVRQAIQVSLEEFGDDAVMLLTVIGSNVKRQLVKEGMWAAIVEVMKKTEQSGGAASPEPEKKKTEKVPRIRAPRQPRQPKVEAPPEQIPDRGKLPFAKAPKGSETAEEFITRWISAGHRYPADMLDWNTGEINWDSLKIYDHKKGSTAWYVYLALVNGKMTYDELCAMKTLEGGDLDRSEVESELPYFMAEPSYLPPGAGVYHEDKDTGQMWIARTPSEALHQSLPFKG